MRCQFTLPGARLRESEEEEEEERRRGRRQQGTRVETPLRVLLYMGRLAITAAAPTTEH